MKAILLLSALAAFSILSGCISVEKETPDRTVERTTTVIHE